MYLIRLRKSLVIVALASIAACGGGGSKLGRPE